MKKNKLLFFCIIMTTLLISLNVFAARTPSIEFNGKIIKSDVDPFIKNDRTLVPLRFISETLGYEVLWNNDKREVTVKDNSTNIKLVIDKNTAKVNGKDIKLDVAPLIKSDRTFVPLRFVAENLNAEVKWDNDNFKVIINKANSLFADLNTEETNYVNAFTSLQSDLEKDYKELKTNFYENESKLSADEIIANYDRLLPKIENTISKIKNLTPPQRFEKSHSYAVKTGDKILDILPKLKESMLSKDTKLMTGYMAELMDYGVIITESKNSFEAALKGKEYTPEDDINLYNERKKNSNLDQALKNIFNNL